MAHIWDFFPSCLQKVEDQKVMKTTNIILSEAFTGNFICAVILGGMKCLLVSIFLFLDFRSNHVQPLSSSLETLTCTQLCSQYRCAVE